MTDLLLRKYKEITNHYPDAIAIHAPDGSLTFAQLDKLSDHLANHIDKTNAKSCLVFMNPSYYFFTALVACMKTCKIAVPIDPTHPDSHLDRIANRVLPQICLTSSELFNRASKVFRTVECFSVNNLSEIEPTVKNSERQVSGNFELHRVFTTGSTGNEKLVTIDRESVYNHAIESAEVYNYKAGEMNANLGRHTSSIIINSYWRSILSGCSLICFDLKTETFEQVRQKLIASNTNRLQGPSSVMGKFIQSIKKRDIRISRINHLIFGGEPLNPGLLQVVSKHFRPVCLITLNYSSTETMLISAFTTSLKNIKTLKSIPAGKPLPTKKIRLFNEEGKEVKNGEPGEVIVSSKYMALEVLDSDHHTNAISIEKSEPGLRTFHTGDMALWNEEGDLVLLGRKDRLIKINGVRIDLTLIEKTLWAFEEIENAAVLAVENNVGNQQIVACVVRKPESISDLDIVNRLLEELHVSHIPTYFVDVNAIPTNLRGKSDQTKLIGIAMDFIRNNDYKKIRIKNRQVAIEKFLFQKWSEVLGKPVINHSKSFFAEGGDSLAASELTFAINSEFDLNLKTVWVFRNPYIQTQIKFLGTVILGEDQETEFAKHPDRNVIQEDELNRLIGW